MGRHSVSFVLIMGLILTDKGCFSIDCYTCTSRNHSAPHCEDPVAPYHIKYTKNCQVPKEGHLGQFPANFCVKMKGTNEVTGETLITRNCVLEDMNSQCGMFKFQDESMRGCILTCDQNGCNEAQSLGSQHVAVISALMLAYIMLECQ